MEKNKSNAGRRKIHGNHTRDYRSPEYVTWDKVKARCYNPNDPSYKRYGAKGIGMCDEWKNNFEAFLRGVGVKPTAKHSLDRFPNKNGNYEPGNVRWATPTEQNRNRNNNVIIEYLGEKKTLSEWCEQFGVSINTVIKRLKANYPLVVAFSKGKIEVVGEDKHNAVFTNAERQEIYDLFVSGVKKADITRRYNSNFSTIHSIIKKFQHEK